MSRTLYVHLGPRKTGTTAIQGLLRRHEDPPVIYPKVGLWPDGAHHGLVFKFLGKNRKGKVPAQSLQEMLDSIAASAAGNDRDIIISSEALHQKRDIAGFVEAVVLCLPQPVKVEFLVICREHFSRVSSWYNHRVRSGERESPDEFLEARAEKICYAPLLRRIRAIGHTVTVLNYHPSDTLVQRFLARIGWNENDIPPAVTRNPGLSPKALVLKLAINNVVGSEKKVLELFARLKEMPGSFAPSQFIFSRAVAEAADLLYADDRSFLKKEFDIEIQPRDLAREQNMFLISEQDLQDITRIAAQLKKHADDIVDFARRFVQPGPRLDGHSTEKGQ
ncbi:MAG TPA: hypothetical protein VKR31_01180 [Rhizomicrobium sp.]|nr:hypothetical protein [Rhizomicrobium sp.]